jgi:hypothetical protein
MRGIGVLMAGGLLVLSASFGPVLAQQSAPPLDPAIERLVSQVEARWGKVGDGRKTQNTTEATLRVCSHLVRTSDAAGFAPQGQNRDVLAGQCIGFFEAQRYAYAYRTPDGRRMFGVCFPEDTNYFSLVKRFLEYALAHPDDHQHGPGLIAWWSALEAWPCPAPKEGSAK